MLHMAPAALKAADYDSSRALEEWRAAILRGDDEACEQWRQSARLANATLERQVYFHTEALHKRWFRGVAVVAFLAGIVTGVGVILIV